MSETLLFIHGAASFPPRPSLHTATAVSRPPLPHFSCSPLRDAPHTFNAPTSRFLSSPPSSQLLTPSMMLARTNGREEIGRGDLEEIDDLFHDAKCSAKLLAAQADKYIS